ncbi:hypothetical protein CC85DRAFT_326715 [Cutaneotrichosporon oleaginosum]|uniref:SEN1 N terminal-domain-containing protein n=1 Tax=Cutaneotrichosporon oleaginosum TaxID=879819 RepID=A0A0J0XT92_9TREE|nr:uncharacterized protein CC85DRAFT_326715 [Cutaneotrichosporon oleaginosum]KLT44306.1 hypothetical protein CC85DRAFT_326715 [Cutaneotrichosporon oleaginosum]TXT11528.1 hypothetical protein COLE_01938 [Cutaneotrichosporon oleaginosum]
MPTPAEVEAILDRRKGRHDTPGDADLAPVYTFLLADTPDAPSHWFCPAAGDLQRRAATYLIVLFAFKRQGTSKTWIDTLANVLQSCAKCARGFASARRTWERLYFSAYPAATRQNFAQVIDKWLAELISPHLEPGGLFDLPPALLQLAFNEPAVLALPTIAGALDKATAAAGSGRTSVADLHISAGLVNLLSSRKPEHRQWARTQIAFISHKPVFFGDFRDGGVGAEVLALLGSTFPGSQAELLSSVQTLVSADRFAPDAIQQGLLAGQYTQDAARPDKSVMAFVARQLGTPSDSFPAVLELFTSILRISPTRHAWAFDTSPELPHTLFSDIKRNASFDALVADARPSNPKGKDKEGTEDTGPLSFITPFLVSVLDAQKAKEGSGFSEALAKVMNYCFAEMQHDRLEVQVRAAVAESGFKTLIALQENVSGTDLGSVAIKSVLEVHASFIARVAFHLKADRGWASAREAARNLTAVVFKVDGREIVENVLGMALIAMNERRRLRRARRAKPNNPVPDAVRVEKLHRVSVHRELWRAAYEAFDPTDPSGLALIIAAVAPFAHIEKLNLNEAWNPDDLGKVVERQEWKLSVRAVNTALDTVREDFPRVVESMAAQLDPLVLGSLWKVPGVAQSVMVLLLSPVEKIHDPIINLIQQSYTEVDDRGDCIRTLLNQHSVEVMDGLYAFLSSFIQTARLVPEAVGLAKWLVRCFTDVMDALCESSGLSPALLQTDAFLSKYANNRRMTRRVSDLWQLMTDSLALIFKRTSDWAPYYDNEVMVDWMRDALIFGRMITDNIRIFESAILSHAKVPQDDPSESPARMSQVGKTLVQKLQVVLADLVGWLRLTDAETLHQAFELLKTILGRVSKSKPDLNTDPQLEATLLELDKFCRRSSNAYKSRISDDMLAELSELVGQFDLAMDDDIQFIKEVKATTPEAGSSDVEPMSSRLKAVAIKDKREDQRDVKPSISATQQKNAFAMMMKKAGGTYTPTEGSSRPKPTKPTKPRQMTLEEFEEQDDFLESLSAHDLDILERRALSTSAKRAEAPKPKKDKLVLNVVPKFYPEKKPSSTSYKSKFMRDLSREHKAQMSEQRRGAPPVTRLPNAAAIGTGIGAYTGPPRPVAKPAPASSDTSDSDSSSDDDNKGLTALLARQKGVLKPATRVPAAPQRFTIAESRPKMGGAAIDLIREREAQRRRAHANRMRLNPDMTPLYRYVLGWNPAHTGTMPPYQDKVAAQIGSLQPVPTAFSSAEHYDKVMLPMFLQELWAQFIKDEQTSGAVTVEVMQKDYEDSFIDLQAVVAGNLPQGFSLNDSDIVTIQPQVPGGRQVFAKVMVFVRRFKEVSMKLRILNDMDPNVGVKGKLVVQKRTTLGTALREFGALRGLPYYEPGILRDILAARSAATPTVSEADVKDAMQKFQVNEPQAKAILGAFAVQGFALIQGPPGTGKTKTISGLVGKFLSERNMPIASHVDAPAKTKILVCAPSNAAIDEVCKRLMDGVPSANGGRIHPKVVRIGMESSVNVAVKDVSLDNIVEARVNTESQRRDGGGSELARVQTELDAVKSQIKEKQLELSRVQGNDQKLKAIEAELHTLNAKRTKLGQQQSRAKDAARDATRHLNGARRAARDAVLKEADIICATLSGAGQEVLKAYQFETVIIDEAAQAIEMSCLIPLKYGARRCIMVGDPNQLPPTTFSIEADKNKYNQSLFVRIAQNRDSHMNLLSIQYRMHPEISELPSKLFYDNRLKDGPGMAEKTAAMWHKTPIFGPYHFVNVNGHETKAGTSTRNTDEARVAVDLYRNLEAQYGNRIDFTMRIGVITMYKEQLNELKRQFRNAFGDEIVEKIDFNTVDGFQGQEKDIIILSCVRSGPNLTTIGFLKDFRRMNVALTRAKSTLFVLGNASTLERSDPRWNTIVGDARERGLLVNYDPTLFSNPKHALPATNGKLKPREASPVRGVVIPKVGTVKGLDDPIKKRKSSPAEEPASKKPRISAPTGNKGSNNSSKNGSVAPSVTGSAATSRVSTPGRRSSPSPPQPTAAPPPPPIGRPSVAPSLPTRPPAAAAYANVPPRPPGLSGPSAGAPPVRPRPPKRPAGEDALFMKKKKPVQRPKGGPPPVNVRAIVNDDVASGRRPPRPS